jgi:hypothetical protein
MFELPRQCRICSNLKRLVADLSLDKSMLQDVLAKKVLYGRCRDLTL